MESPERGRGRLRRALILFYATAGVLHLTLPVPFLSITPHWVPWPAEVIMLTGLAELFGALGLSTPALRRAAGIGLALYAICVYPANIKQAIDALGTGHGTALQWAYHLLRLPLQPLIVWAALFAGGTVTWPCRQKTSPLTVDDTGPEPVVGRALPR
ncbi:DoxX family protein [Rhizobium halophytocola]|uniref:Membrane protein n=1 Tax=Rhizobium halophytocola TaxID=735519 RepID=A0ABS4DVG2_9HYPH|nr:DoxX family protein [Rhizobium halophytocola]MBP1849671.1 putative membrane protein [Rhizobium halophytocola]